MTTYNSALLGAGRAAVLAACVLLLAALPATAQQEQPEGAGEAVYSAHCAQCHGSEGDGRGHAFDVVFPRPRDFTSGMFKFRTTESGEPPTRENLIQIVARGMPGTGMPAWQGVLSEGEIGQVSDYVQRFYVEEPGQIFTTFTHKYAKRRKRASQARRCIFICRYRSFIRAEFFAIRNFSSNLKTR